MCNDVIKEIISMSAGSKKKLKQFTIDNIQDGCLALSMLITGVIVNLEKYKEYAEEAEQLLSNADSECIPAKAYDDINDKLLYRQREILKLCADHQNSSFAYIDLRKILEKQGYLTTSLSEEAAGILNELLDVRNWTFHNPQSLLVAAKEAAEKNIPDELKGIATIVPQLNPVLIRKIDAYDLLTLASLTIHTQRRISQFETILNCMKSDYQEMFNSIENKPLLLGVNGFTSDIQYIDRHVVAHLDDYNSDVAQISMAIQKSKYDGSDELFNKWVVRFNKQAEEKED